MRLEARKVAIIALCLICLSFLPFMIMIIFFLNETDASGTMEPISSSFRLPEHVIACLFYFLPNSLMLPPQTHSKSKWTTFISYSIPFNFISNLIARKHALVVSLNSSERRSWSRCQTGDHFGAALSSPGSKWVHAFGRNWKKCTRTTSRMAAKVLSYTSKTRCPTCLSTREANATIPITLTMPMARTMRLKRTRFSSSSQTI